MATRKGINISGHYVVHHELYAFFIYSVLNRKVGRIVVYIVFKTQRPSDTVF